MAASTDSVVRVIATKTELDNLMEEWLNAVEGTDSATTESVLGLLTTRQSDHFFLRKLNDVIKCINSIGGFLSHMYNKEMASPDTDLLEVYEFVKEKLDALIVLENIEELYSDAPYPLPINPKPKAFYLLTWGAELWFMNNLQSCHDPSVSEWVTNHGKILFEKFFVPLKDANSTRFELLCEENCVAMVKRLLSTKSVGNTLKGYLMKRENVTTISKQGMSTSMSCLMSDHSENFYIIPVNSEKSKMYGIHIPICHYMGYEVDSEGTMLTKALGHIAVEVINLPSESIYKSENLTFSTLFAWLQKELSKEHIQEKCSLLFFSMSCHGCQAHVADAVWLNAEIVEILKLVNKGNLRTIPKVVVIQACQGYPAEGALKYECSLHGVINPYNLQPIQSQSDIPKKMEDIVRKHTDNTLVVMAAGDNQYYDALPYVGTFLVTYAECVKRAAGTETTFGNIAVEAVKENEAKYAKYATSPHGEKLDQSANVINSLDGDKGIPVPPNVVPPQGEVDDDNEEI